MSKPTQESIYRTYVEFCQSVGIKPAPLEHWSWMSSKLAEAPLPRYNKRK